MDTLVDTRPHFPENQIKLIFWGLGTNLPSVDFNNERETGFHQNGEKKGPNKRIVGNRQSWRIFLPHGLHKQIKCTS